MEVRVIEDISIGEDLTPPLPPLAFALHDSALKSHCSACFSLLPPQPFTPLTPSNPLNSLYVPTTILYCSHHCSSLDSSLHLSSAEPQLLSLFHHSPPSTWEDSSDLRLSLRLLHIFNSEKSERSNDQNERIAGLMTNREMLAFRDIKNNPFQDSDKRENPFENEFENEFKRIKLGARAIAMARLLYLDNSLNIDSHEEEMVLCLVLTNAVEVLDKNGCSLGVAVYGNPFSWINHSCSPNACYRFSLGSEHNIEQSLKIFPAACNANGDDVIMEGDIKVPFSGRHGCGYGPRVIVRSIKVVKKGEEVTISYTDLLQPKEMRQSELWLKYKFKCRCKRCSALPVNYVDSSLQAVCTVSHDIYTGEEIKKLIKAFQDSISDYLSFSNPKLCLEKLESLLSNGDYDDQVKMKATKANLKLKLHPFHHVSLNAFTTIASAYEVYASNLLALDSSDCHKLQALSMSKLSAAYSLLLAGVSNHLFMFETSLIASNAIFWVNAGESLLSLIKYFNLDSPSIWSHKCSDCPIMGIHGHEVSWNVQLEEIKRQQLNCIANITSKVWSWLGSGSTYLGIIKNPIDFSWLQSAESFKGFSGVEIGVEECSEQVKIDLFRLSSHCLRYGALLSSLCYGFQLAVEM